MKPKGKKIDTWTFTINKVDVQLPVSLRRKAAGYGSFVETVFFVHVPEYGLNDEGGDDLNELKARVKAHLERFMSLTWSRFYLVQVALHTGDEDSIEFKFAYDVVEITTLPDGSQRWRAHASYRSDNGIPVTGLSDGWRPEMTALVPATLESLKALKQLSLALKALGKTWQNLLSPKRILDTLSNVESLIHLPAIPVAPKKKQKK